jgi:hypothetical protein
MQSSVKGARLSSFGRQGDRTTTFGVGEPCRNPLPTLADQLLGERVFCFQQRPVTYSGSPPVTLPPAASGNQGSSSRYCPGEGNRSARKSGKPWGGFKPSGVTRQSFRHASRSGKPVSRNDGWLHAWEGFVPRLGDNVFTQDSPSQEGLHEQLTTMKQKRPASKCGTCKHGGPHFKLSSGTHLYCQHPDDKVSGAEHKSPWDFFRNWYDHCPSWESKTPAADNCSTLSP